MTDPLEQVLSPAGPELLRLEARRYEDLSDYLGSLFARYQHNNLIADIGQVSLSVEPEDRTLGVDEDYEKANAFFKGALIGYRIADEFLPRDALRLMSKVDVGQLYDDDDELHNLHQSASDLIESGARGFEMAEPYHDLLEEWEDMICSDVTLQPYLKRGFGLIFYMMNGAREEAARRDLEGMQKLLDEAPLDGLNWDSEFEKLLRDEGL